MNKKIALIMAFLAFSTSSFALYVTEDDIMGLAMVSYLGSTASTVLLAKEEVRPRINNDAQDFYVHGKLSVTLSDLIQGIQNDNPELSDSEAIDLLVKAFN